MEDSKQNITLKGKLECPLIRKFSTLDETPDSTYRDRAFCSRPLSVRNGCMIGYGYDGCVDICEAGASISFCPVDGLITEEKLREFEQASKLEFA